MKRVLPFKYPTITSWTWIAGTFAILENYENSYPWLYNNFTQMFCETHEKWVSAHYIPHLDVFSRCPLLKTALIERKILLYDNKDIIELIKQCINLGYYVYCKMDEKCIIGYEKPCLHELMIYGYDDEQSVCYIADFILNSSQKYSFATTSYDNIREAYKSVNEKDDDMQDGIGGDGGIFIMSVNSEYKYEFDMELMITSLNDYVQCKDSGAIYRTYNIKKESSFSKGLKKLSYGLDVYKEISEYYLKVGDGMYFFIMPLHILFDHKVLMLKRLEYLKNKLNISIPEELIQQCNHLMKEALCIRNLGVKYWVKKDRRILKNISSHLLLLMKQDKQFSEELLSVLKG